MDSNLKKLIPFALTYKKNIFFNVFFNIFYALFSTLLMVSMIPTLNVLFGLNEKVTSPPIFNGIGSIKQYSEQVLNYKITSLTANYDFKIALLFVISIIISTAFLKNAANYFASYHVTRLRNGVLRDIREKLYNKIIHLPISFYSEKRKGDVMSRMLGDVNEVQN